MRDGVEVKGIAATDAEVDPDGFIELVSQLFPWHPDFHWPEKNGS